MYLDCPNCEKPNNYTKTRGCEFCSNTGLVHIDKDAIEKAVTSSRGKNKGKLRASRPKLPGEDGAVYGAAFVWRMIRFHCGADMTMPITAYYHVGLPTFKTERSEKVATALNNLVDEIGEKLVGLVPMYRAAARWGSVLGLEGADEVFDKVNATVGVPSGDGYDVDTTSAEYAVSVMEEERDTYPIRAETLF